MQRHRGSSTRGHVSTASHLLTPAQLWWSYVRLPLVLFTITFALIEMTHADVRVAQALFFDPLSPGWVGADSVWTNTVLHTGGQWFVRVVCLAAIVIWVATYRGVRVCWRRPSAYLALTCVLGVGAVGGLKVLLHVPCPWSLQLFGGPLPYVPLLASHAATAHVGGCFPAAHAASGYTLSSGYFVLRERSRRWACAALAFGVSLGLIFGIAQQSRGAHFVSHDLCSALLTWLIAAGLYVFAFRARLWSAWQRQPELHTMAPPQPMQSSIEPPASQLQPLGMATALRPLLRAARTRGEHR